MQGRAKDFMKHWGVKSELRKRLGLQLCGTTIAYHASSYPSAHVSQKPQGHATTSWDHALQDVSTNADPKGSTLQKETTKRVTWIPLGYNFNSERKHHYNKLFHGNTIEMHCNEDDGSTTALISMFFLRFLDVIRPGFAELSFCTADTRMWDMCRLFAIPQPFPYQLHVFESITVRCIPNLHSFGAFSKSQFRSIRTIPVVCLCPWPVRISWGLSSMSFDPLLLLCHGILSSQSWQPQSVRYLDSVRTRSAWWPIDDIGQKGQLLDFGFSEVQQSEYHSVGPRCRSFQPDFSTNQPSSCP